MVLAPAVPGEPRRVLSLGDAKWGKSMGPEHVQRLARARDMLAARGYDTRDTVIACYSGGGFDPQIAQAVPDRVITVGLAQLYAQEG